MEESAKKNIKTGEMIMSKGEFYFQWHFMNNCNLRCAHCYQEGYSSVELPLENLLLIAKQISTALKKWNMLGRISLTGGEPFLSKNLLPIIDYLEHDINIKQFDILTNGTCITPEQMGALKQSRKLHQIQISMDGPDALTHDSVRGAGTFQKVLHTIERLHENDIEISFMFTLMQKNKDHALAMIDFAEKYGIKALTIERVTPCGHSAIPDLLSREELRQIYEAITKRANSAEMLTIRRLRPLWINTMSLNLKEDAKIGGFCPVGLTSLTILHDGTVLPCRRLNIPLGNILQDGLFKIWYENEILWKIRDKSNLKGKCHNCKNVERCGGCRAVAYEVTGDYMGEDPQCWI